MLNSRSRCITASGCRSLAALACAIIAIVMVQFAELFSTRLEYTPGTALPEAGWCGDTIRHEMP